ncbi:hypothetical protein BTK96_000699 [Burkholderia pyrrocinia]|uniref:hypothetical protein n=1 Tax=Burkholderia sp. IT-111MI5 TaxID=3026439 RepID=UPI002A2EB909|nr:hypothetical protein [Burkholderia pyrrocinia]EKS9893470.1 hypothetical protein [Burkholderia pyrrocinia]EKS9905644.1 hypothetical protein [Burkholderia pyrrocinia]
MVSVAGAFDRSCDTRLGLAGAPKQIAAPGGEHPRTAAYFPNGRSRSFLFALSFSRLRTDRRHVGSDVRFRHPFIEREKSLEQAHYDHGALCGPDKCSSNTGR